MARLESCPAPTPRSCPTAGPGRHYAQRMDFKPGGLLGVSGPVDIRDLGRPHPWKTEFIVPLQATLEQRAYVAAVMEFQSEIDLLDTSWLDEQ